MVLPAFVSSLTADDIKVIAAGHVISLMMSNTNRKAFVKKKVVGSACWILIER